MPRLLHHISVRYLGYLGRTRRYPVNIYNLYRNLYKTKRQTA